ncbi:hypothetical protein ASG85_17995 [Paenibacillus sp. Soil724D2]|nr:hypothetical protein ASG85_17995 [Paenibacillus sp. Soil724D2]
MEAARPYSEKFKEVVASIAAGTKGVKYPMLSKIGFWSLNTSCERHNESIDGLQHTTSLACQEEIKEIVARCTTCYYFRCGLPLNHAHAAFLRYCFMIVGRI